MQNTQNKTNIQNNKNEEKKTKWVNLNTLSPTPNLFQIKGKK